MITPRTRAKTTMHALAKTVELAFNLIIEHARPSSANSAQQSSGHPWSRVKGNALGITGARIHGQESKGRRLIATKKTFLGNNQADNSVQK